MSIHPIASAISTIWARNGAYLERLVGDLTESQWIAQPVSGVMMNHPAWIFSHLNLYTPLCTAMLRGESFPDPIDAPFGQKSQVSGNAKDYATGAALREAFQRSHESAVQALAGAPVSVFSTPTPLERWRLLNPTVGDMLVTLMVKHESSHLGQLSAWRRAMNLARVAM